MEQAKGTAPPFPQAARFCALAGLQAGGVREALGARGRTWHLQGSRQWQELEPSPRPPGEAPAAEAVRPMVGLASALPPRRSDTHTPAGVCACPDFLDESGERPDESGAPMSRASATSACRCCGVVGGRSGWLSSGATAGRDDVGVRSSIGSARVGGPVLAAGRLVLRQF